MRSKRPWPEVKVIEMRRALLLSLEKSTFSFFLASTRMSRSFFGFVGKSSIFPVVLIILDTFVIASVVEHGLILNLL